MPTHELRAQLTARPFVPFRLVLTDGMTYEVRHPDMLLLTLQFAHIGYPDPQNPGMALRADIVALSHIQRIEEVQPAQS